MRHYIAVLIPEADGGWSVLFPDLPGCATQGETLDEAIAMAGDALAGHLAVMEDYGDAIPVARSLEAIRADTDWCAAHDVTWGEVLAAPILARAPIGKPERVTISLDSNVLRAIDAYAEKMGHTRSTVLTAGAELLLGRRVEDMRNESLELLAAIAPDMAAGVARLENIATGKHATVKLQRSGKPKSAQRKDAHPNTGAKGPLTPTERRMVKLRKKA